jgi:phosphoenolpyruvate carboxykinase (diphosphate)
VPELWCRMRVAEREPQFLIENGYLEKIGNFEFGGREVLASRLGYRITPSFVDRFLGRIFEMPGTVFPEEMLRPEKQDPGEFAEGVNAIVDAQRAVAKDYFEDGSIDAACPPIKAILHIMAYGEYDGKDENDPEIRKLFTRESLIASDWYRHRLETQQALDVALWTNHRDAVQKFMASGLPAPHIDLPSRLAVTGEHLKAAKTETYITKLVGTIGADPAFRGSCGSALS